MRTDLCLVLDQGSHSSRAMVFDRTGHCISQAQVAVHIQLTPPNRAEQDPEEILLSLKRAALEALSCLSQPDRARLKSAALITQRSSLLCWDADNGQPLTPVISWQDRRGAHYIDDLADKADYMRTLTGLYPNAHAPASKLRWCLEHLTFTTASHRIKGGPIAAWLLKRLLKEQPNVIDGVTAARTMLYSLHRKNWDPELLELFQLPESMLPEIRPCKHLYGHLKLAGCQLPLTLVSGDQAAALFAFGTPQPENLYINLGSGAFINRILPDSHAQAPNRLLHHLILAGKQPLFSIEATINGAANALDWGFNFCRPHSRNLDQWAGMIKHPPVFLNMVGGVGSPDWCALDRSCWVGGDEADAKARLVAIMESIVFLIQRNISAMQDLPPPEAIYVGGGISQLNSLCQRLADLTGLPVIRHPQAEITALGAAWLVLPYSQRSLQPERTFQPTKNSALHKRYKTWSEQFALHLIRIFNQG